MSTRSLLHALVLSAIAVTASSTVLFAQTAAAPGAPATGTQAPAIPGGGRGGFPPVQIGPSAPVPPEVAIPRPSPAELAQINAAVSAFVSSDRSPAAAVLRKYASLLVVPPPRLNVAATYTQTVQRMGPRHEGFVETAKKGGIDLLLLGDSITDWWQQTDENRALYNQYFGHIKTANFGIAGDTTQGVLWGLHNGEGQGFQPKAVMLMIGTNNSGAYSAPEMAEGVGAIVLELRQNFPNAKILLLAIFPRSVPGDPVRDKIAEANRIISRLDDQQHVFYVDIGSKFLDEKGFLLPNVFRPDNLHPAALGYDVWGQAVQAKLAELMK